MTTRQSSPASFCSFSINVTTILGQQCATVIQATLSSYLGFPIHSGMLQLSPDSLLPSHIRRYRKCCNGTGVLSPSYLDKQFNIWILVLTALGHDVKRMRSACILNVNTYCPLFILKALHPLQTKQNKLKSDVLPHSSFLSVHTNNFGVSCFIQNFSCVKNKQNKLLHCLLQMRWTVGPGGRQRLVLWFRHRCRAELAVTDTEWRTGVSV